MTTAPIVPGPRWRLAELWRLDDYDASFELARKAKRARFRAEWTVWLVSACRRHKSLRKHVVALCRRMADVEADRLAFETAWRLTGVQGGGKLLKVWTTPPRRKKDRYEALELARKARTKRAVERERIAREMLQLHSRKLAREKRLVAKWTRIVARYDRKG